MTPEFTLAAIWIFITIALVTHLAVGGVVLYRVGRIVRESDRLAREVEDLLEQPPGRTRTTTRS